MTTAAPPLTQPTARVPGWQTAVAVISVTALSLVVIVPVSGAILLLLALAFWLAGAVPLELVGALNDSALGEAATVATTTLACAIAVSAFHALRSRSVTPASSKTEPPPPPASRAPFGWRHPWLAIVASACVVDFSLVPLHITKVVTLPPGLLGAGILLTEAVPLLAVTYGILRIWWFAVASTWRGSRRSAFVAGAATAGSLVVTLLALMIGHASARAADALQGSKRAEPPACGGALACTRVAAQTALRQTAIVPAEPAAIAPIEVPPGFAACVEDLHRAESGRTSAREDAMRIVRSMAIINEAEAEDAVHAALIAVCVASPRIHELRPYFIQSAINAAKRAKRQSRHWCPTNLEDPSWLPSACIVPERPDGGGTEAMEKAGHRALCALGGEQRRIIEMRVWEGLSYAEVGRLLGCGEATARQRYHRAIDALKQEFDAICR